MRTQPAAKVVPVEKGATASVRPLKAAKVVPGVTHSSLRTASRQEDAAGMAGMAVPEHREVAGAEVAQHHCL
jgi:hypothetical protein